MISSFIIFLAWFQQSSVLAADSYYPIPDSIYTKCSSKPSPSGITSDHNCGAGLDCVTMNSFYGQCRPNPALAASIGLTPGSRPQVCPFSQVNVTGQGTKDTCAIGSYCTGTSIYYSQCEVCRSKLETCGASVAKPEYPCCPGMQLPFLFIFKPLILSHYTMLSLGSSCQQVDAIVAGKPATMNICVPDKPIPTSTTLVKRGVRTGGSAPTNYCYSGCSGVKII